MKAARTAAPCWVFSIVQRKDRPSHGTASQGFSMGGAGRLPGKPERNAVPREGEAMGNRRAGNGLPPLREKHHIHSIHTAVPSKGTAVFFYSTHFYLFPGQATKEYIIFTSGIPAVRRVCFLCALTAGRLRAYRGRAPPSGLES